MRFQDRMYNIGITEELFREATDYDETEKREVLEKAANRLERNYNCVATIREGKKTDVLYSQTFQIRAIAAQDAEESVMRRAMEMAQYWVLEGEL